MKNQIRLTVVAALVVALGTGCETMPDDQRTRTEGTAAGAIIGGLLGYAIDRERGAAVGALLGAGVGFAVGNEVAKRKAEYANIEDFLDAEAVRVAEFNTTAVAYNQRLSADVVALEREARALRARYDAGTAQKSALQAQRGELQEKIASARQLEETLAKELEVQNAILAQESKGRPAEDPHVKRLQTEVAELQRNLNTLREGSAQLARIDQRLSV